MKRLYIFLIFALVILFPISVFAQAARIIEVKGNVTVKKDIKAKWEKAKINMVLNKEAEVQTKKNSECIIAFDEEQRNILTIKENSNIKIESIKPGKVFLPQGRVFSLIENLAKAEVFQVRTPVAVAGARGTGWLSEFINGQASFYCFVDEIFIQGLDESGNITGEEELSDGFGRYVGEGGVIGDSFGLGDTENREWGDFVGQVDDLTMGEGLEGAGEEEGFDEGMGMGDDLREDQREDYREIFEEEERGEEEWEWERGSNSGS